MAVALQKKGIEIKSKQKDLGAIIGSAKAFIIAPGIETMLEGTNVLDEFLKRPRFAQNPYSLGKNGADQVVDILEPVLDSDFFDEKVLEMVMRP